MKFKSKTIKQLSITLPSWPQLVNPMISKQIDQHSGINTICSMEHGCLYSLRVLEGKPVRSPLTQGGLEIQCIVTVNWASDDGLNILRSSIEKICSFGYESKTVLQSFKNLYEVEEEVEEVLDWKF